MENRWVYRGVEEAVRLGKDYSGLYHTAITRRLRFGYGNVQDDLRVYESNMLAKAILAAGLKYNGASDDLNRSFKDYVRSLPYMRRTIDDAENEKSTQAANSGRALMEKYIKYREMLRQEASEKTTTQEA